MTGATSGAGTAYPSGATEFTPGLLWVRVKFWYEQYLIGVYEQKIRRV
jgi:hypothetical protein